MNQVVNLYASEREAEAISSKASRAEFSKDYDQAFKLYIKAAEAFLHLSRVTGATDTATQRWKSSANKSLERAEKIKRFVEASRRAVIPPSNSDQQPAAELHLTPVAIDHFSHQEQLYVLKRGSHVNGLIFPLWDDPISMPNCQSVGYIDPDGQPKLSPDQERVSPIWRRPGFTLLSPATTKPSRRILPQEILQHVVTDCSVCASISVCLEHGRRFGSTLAESSVRSLSDGQQVNGRYDIRILFNGAWRRIGEVSPINQLFASFQGFLVVDDQLPFHPTEGTVMCMSILSPKSTEAPDVEEAPLWPSLLEKAYMKLMGGYDFPGSNSSIDLQ
ncbi:unnamed protein product [Cyclocybe aegerita]|uniref:Calpain catalytic domain-containing protein n=1 Tax=Cyclocybe aegerita TaxID=1973307 RepID=A0A8S0XTJ7_CYCAE|nr:unnamed protein product [Cyclocybe aegerita]